MNDESPPPEPKPAPPYARRGMSVGRAWVVFALAGVAYLAAAALKVVVHQPEGPLFAGCGVAFLIVGWLMKPKKPAATK